MPSRWSWWWSTSFSAAAPVRRGRAYGGCAVFTAARLGWLGGRRVVNVEGLVWPGVTTP